MKLFPRLLLLLSALMFSNATFAIEPIEFKNAAEQQRFTALSAELRCVMCQNQSIADSNAPIAHDLRLEVLKLMREGKSDAQIKEYLVARYSDFVLYEPRLQKKTWLLWLGPFLVLIIGGILLTRIIRTKNSKAVAEYNDNTQEW